MAEAKRERTGKKQMGQFMTPLSLAERLTLPLELDENSKVLEPGFGEGSFLIAIIDKLLESGSGSKLERLDRIFTHQLYGVELDEVMYARAIERLIDKYGPLPPNHNLRKNDFFSEDYAPSSFDFVIGNPPFGGTFNPEIEDQLDRQYGKWSGYKVKKETYAFFIAKSLDLLKVSGCLQFITSDTFLTISTMKGLRRRLMDQCDNEVNSLKVFSHETNYPMVVLTSIKGDSKGNIKINGNVVGYEDIELTDNLSWSVEGDFVKYFHGDKLAKYVICSSGMTIGKNEYFLRQLASDGTFDEPYEFMFYQKPITLKEAIDQARLGKMSLTQRALLLAKEANGETYRALTIINRAQPQKLAYPHEDYRPYNKATKDIVYSAPRYVIYWKDGGDAVLTYKKTGNWYLRGVGGQKFFGREGLTWQLISSRINMKYLPPGYILDSGAPCAFLKEGVDAEELWFILGWTLTDLATNILKTVINHTKNIQGKDLERMPYPWWVSPAKKQQIIEHVQALVDSARNGETIDRQDSRLKLLNDLFAMPEDYHHHSQPTQYTQLGLIAQSLQ